MKNALKWIFAIVSNLLQALAYKVKDGSAVGNIGRQLRLSNFIGLFSDNLKSFLVLLKGFSFKQCGHMAHLFANSVLNVTLYMEEGFVKLFSR